MRGVVIGRYEATGKRWAVGIREDETVDTASPVRRSGLSKLLRALGLCVALAGVLGAAVIGLSPSLRQRVVALRTPVVLVSIGSTPAGAEVFIDEEPWGRTPAQARLAPGPHGVRIVCEKYKPFRRAFDPAQTRELAPTLQPLELATLVVESEPRGARVALDGERRGTTPLTLSRVEAGAHTVCIDGEPLYAAATRQVQLQADETCRLAIRLVSKLELLYRDQIKQQPKMLANYTDFVHYYLAEERTQEAAAVATTALRVPDPAEAPSVVLRQFYAQLDTLCSARASGINAAAKEELLDAVQALFARLAAAKSDDPDQYLPVAQILGKGGRFAKVLEACDEAVQRGRVPGVVHVNIAEAYLGRGEPKPAILLLEHATKLQPDHSPAHCRLAVAYHRDERYDDALREYETAARLSAGASAERKSALQIEIARLLADKGDTEGAVARYEKALGLDAAAGGRADLARGLIAHYPFDKDASDASGKGHHGENHGAIVVPGGKIGGAFSFDGEKAYVAIPAQATRGLAASTFALWVKTTQSEAKSRYAYYTNTTVLGVDTNGFGSGDLGLMLEKGNVAYFHGLTPDNKDMAWFSAVPVNDDTWHHIAFVNAGSLALVYVDGRLARGEAFSNGAGSSRLGVVSDTSTGGVLCKDPLFLGASAQVLGRTRATSFYRGLIDDVRIWSRALRAAEVAALCARGGNTGKP